MLNCIIYEDMWRNRPPIFLPQQLYRLMETAHQKLTTQIKLPFPAPDPILEYERSLHESFHRYLSEVIVPSMLVKLRQWIGRGIRRETDTYVFSIPGSRVSGRYRKDILSALPD